jgi:hypothetical protein
VGCTDFRTLSEDGDEINMLCSFEREEGLKSQKLCSMMHRNIGYVSMMSGPTKPQSIIRCLEHFKYFIWNKFHHTQFFYKVVQI